MSCKTVQTSPGSAHPLGATVDEDGVNFSVFSDRASSVELLLFDSPENSGPTQIIQLDQDLNRSGAIWHVRVSGLKPGVCYAYRVSGDTAREPGERFNPNKLLIDPYARANSDVVWVRGDACGDVDNTATAMRSIVISIDDYDWEGVAPPRTPMKDSVIYEVHVGGFTRHSSSGTANRGTFAGVIEKIPYLKSLGITAVELLPVFEFDDKEDFGKGPNGGLLKNYWGYSTLGFFSPHAGYCISAEPQARIREFRNMVKALHRAGIEVLLDVVFNHTTEGNHLGPVISFKGLANSTYYYLVNGQPQYYMDYSGCGNTMNCNHPVVAKFIQDCLEFWVREMHVDGFRFDEGSILSRGLDGARDSYARVLWNIELSEVLADTKLIAEAWDAGGLYEVGGFPGYRWAEWNGRFRDDVRRFVRGDEGVVGAVATRIAGSADIYSHERHTPTNSINFVTCHDGFTLKDLVSYNGKHNEANGEGNRDGINDNLSWNCGVEGETDDLAVQNFRGRQLKNFATVLLLSQGVPMILGGDEFGRTQGGNNNAYCQDNEISWFNWGLATQNEGLVRFYSRLIAFRRSHSALRRGRFFNGSVNDRGLRDIEWHGCELFQPGWNDPSCRVLSFTMAGFEEGEPDLHVMFNMSVATLPFALPDVRGRMWHRFADTALDAPNDIAETGAEVPISGSEYLVTRRSSVILVSK